LSLMCSRVLWVELIDPPEVSAFSPPLLGIGNIASWRFCDLAVAAC